MNWTISGGTVLRGGRLETSDLAITGGRIVDAASPGAERIDARGLLVLPGIVDVHGDAFERQIMPRPGVRFDTAMALLDTDRQMLANGITTAFHGVTVSWEPGLRSVDAARTFIADLMRLRDRLGCDTRLHIRWETFALEEMAQVADWLALEPRPILALNDHTTGSVLKGHIARKIGQMAERSGLTREDYMALLDRIWSRRDMVDDAIAGMAEAARRGGNILLAHDECSVDERRRFRELGAISSEFPMNFETAAEARAAGEHVILGAPNVVRGGSHNGALCAQEAVERGLCSVLTSDYHYPSPLHAAFKLAESQAAGIAAVWPLVSANPASASGLNDRGTLDQGRRADLILVDARDPVHPQVVATKVAGRIVYARRAFDRPQTVAPAHAEYA